MRLFVGIAMPEEVLQLVQTFVDSLRPIADLKWSPVADLHLTTKFIGDQPEARIAAIERALADVEAPPPFRLVVRGVGWFPNDESPHVFWAGIEPSPELTTLAAETERRLAPLGIAIEQRAYSPHVTLARIPRGADLEALREAVRDSSPDFGTFTVEHFSLYESRRADRTTRYCALRTFPLGRPPEVATSE